MSKVFLALAICGCQAAESGDPKRIIANDATRQVTVQEDLDVEGCIEQFMASGPYAFCEQKVNVPSAATGFRILDESKFDTPAQEGSSQISLTLRNKSGGGINEVGQPLRNVDLVLQLSGGCNSSRCPATIAKVLRARQLPPSVTFTYLVPALP